MNPEILEQIVPGTYIRLYQRYDCHGEITRRNGGWVRIEWFFLYSPQHNNGGRYDLSEVEHSVRKGWWLLCEHEFL